MLIAQIIFVCCLAVAVFVFTRNVKKIIRNIHLGRDERISGDTAKRWTTLLRVALGQSKMLTKPIAGFFHIIIYAGFIIINTEVLEIVLDGILGTHRLFAAILPAALYNTIIIVYELLAAGTLIAAIVFLWTP